MSHIDNWTRWRIFGTTWSCYRSIAWRRNWICWWKYINLFNNRVIIFYVLKSCFIWNINGRFKYSLWCETTHSRIYKWRSISRSITKIRSRSSWIIRSINTIILIVLIHLIYEFIIPRNIIVQIRYIFSLFNFLSI